LENGMNTQKLRIRDVGLLVWKKKRGKPPPELLKGNGQAEVHSFVDAVLDRKEGKEGWTSD